MKLMSVSTRRYLNLVIYGTILAVLVISCTNSCAAPSISSDYPNVVGKHQARAEDTLKANNISYTIIYGINESCRERYVFDQKINDSMMIVYVNKRLDRLEIQDKMNTDIIDLSKGDQKMIYVNNTLVIDGYLASDLKENEHIWLAVNPYSSIRNWWPQSGGDIKPVNQEFKGNVFLGGNGQTFGIAILIVNDTLNQIFSDWEVHCMNKNNWPPITEGDPVTGINVSKEIIESNILTDFKVYLP